MARTRRRWSERERRELLAVQAESICPADRSAIRWLVLPAVVVVALGGGCDCVSANTFGRTEVAALSSCPQPDRVAGSGVTARATLVAWVGTYQRTDRHPDHVELEYRFVPVLDLADVLARARRGEQLSVNPSAAHQSEQVFFVRVATAMKPERWQELSTPWPVALWAGEAARDGSKTVLTPLYAACEVQLESPSR